MLRVTTQAHTSRKKDSSSGRVSPLEGFRCLETLETGSVGAVIFSAPDLSELGGQTSPETPSEIWRQCRGGKGAQVFPIVSEVARVLSEDGWAWISAPRRVDRLIELSAGASGLRWTSDLIHLHPVTRKNRHHDPEDARRARGLVTSHHTWSLYRSESSKGWLNGDDEAFPRRPTSVILSEPSGEGIVSDAWTFDRSQLRAFMAPVNPSELRLGVEDRCTTPNPTSIDLARMLIRLSTKPGDLVVDPMAGSGSVGVAAVLEGRRFVGAEIREDRANHANDRIQWWAENAHRVAPLELDTLDRLVARAPRETKKLRIRLPVRLSKTIETRGASLPATLRAALQTWFDLPLRDVENALPPKSLSHGEWTGTEKGISVVISAATSHLLETAGKEGYSVAATAKSALANWTTGQVIPFVGCRPRG